MGWGEGNDVYHGGNNKKFSKCKEIVFENIKFVDEDKKYDNIVIESDTTYNVELSYNKYGRDIFIVQWSNVHDSRRKLNSSEGKKILEIIDKESNFYKVLLKYIENDYLE